MSGIGEIENNIYFTIPRNYNRRTKEGGEIDFNQTNHHKYVLVCLRSWVHGMISDSIL